MKKKKIRQKVLIGTIFKIEVYKKFEICRHSFFQNYHNDNNEGDLGKCLSHIYCKN